MIEVPDGALFEPRSRLLRPGQDPDGGVYRHAVRPGGDAAEDRRPRPAGQLGGRAPALPPAGNDRRAHRRRAQGGPRADRRRPREDDRADGPGGDGGDPAAGLPADAGRGPRPPGRRPPDLHRQRRRQRHGRVPGAVLGMEGGIGTRYEVDAEGDFTGRLEGPSSTGAGKVEAMQRFADQHPDRASSPPTPTPTGSRTCRCCAPSAIRSPSTPTRRWPRSPRQRAGRRWRFERLGRRLVAIAVTVLATVAGFGARRVATRRR